MTDQGHQAEQDRKEFSDEAGSLWRIALAPSVWAGHFVLCYASVSLACVRGLLPIEATRLSLIAVSVIVLVFFVWQGWRAWRQWAPERGHPSALSEGKAEDRHRFLGHATFLLTLISGIATVYTTLPLLLLEGCG